MQIEILDHETLADEFLAVIGLKVGAQLIQSQRTHIVAHVEVLAPTACVAGAAA